MRVLITAWYLMVACTVVAVLLPACAEELPQPVALTAAPANTPVQQEELYLRAMQELDDGHAEEASALLLRFLEKEPQHAGAWLDLAISQCELGHATEAERLFGEIEKRFSPPPGIVEVIANRRATGCRPPPQKKHNLLALALGRGYDSNVNQGSSSQYFTTGSGINQATFELSPDYLPKPDDYTLTSLDYTHLFDDKGTSVFAQLRGRHNDNVHEQDINSLLVGAERNWILSNWTARTTIALGIVQLGDQLYQRQSQLLLKIIPPLSMPEHVDWALTAGLTHATYPTRQHYDGNTAEIGSAITHQGNKIHSSLSVGLLSDRGDAERLGGDRQGWYANAYAYATIGEKFLGELGWTRQRWHSDAIYSPGLIDVVRNENIQQLRTAVSWNVASHQNVLLEFRIARDKENISLFQYNSRMLQLSWRWDNY